MIGIFDSGSGGLTFLSAIKKRFPEWSYIYYADYDHCPFWERTPQEIQALTISGVRKLFDAGATLVILACNTASAWTLRKIQTENIFPGKKVLGVTIPGAEKVIELWLQSVTVFATEQTVKSRTYADRVRILDADTIVHEIAFSGDLVRDIESSLPVYQCRSEEDFYILFDLYGLDWWNYPDDWWDEIIRKYFLHTLVEGSIILWCTHYSYLKKSLQNLFPNSVIIDPSEESASKLWSYLQKREELLSQIKKTGTIKFL